MYRKKWTTVRRFKQEAITRYHYIRARSSTKVVVHLLHIGKTGGTAIKNCLRINCRPYLNDTFAVFSHSHGTRLRDVPVGEKVFFFVRDPISRFVSGFYSRKHKGVHGAREWSAAERTAFSLFETPNQLAEALDSENEELRSAAQSAMRAIGHVKQSCWHWFENEEYLSSRLDDILFIGNQETLSEDFCRLRTVLCIPDVYQLPHDKKGAHIGAYTSCELNKLAVLNLCVWYKRDYEFLVWLKKHNLVKRSILSPCTK